MTSDRPPTPDASRDDARTDQPDVGSADADATPLCLNCLKEVPPLAAFCPACSAPVGTFATLDPINSIHATGWLYRKAARGTGSRVALVGMWLIFLPAAIVVLLGLMAVAWYGAGGADNVGWLASAAMGVVYVAILVRVSRGHRRSMRLERGLCQRCGYDITHLTESRCPECGESFDPKALPGQEDDAQA